MHWRGIDNRKPVSLAMILATLAIAATLMISPIEISANDSVARFGAGGIELIKSEDIRILEEILEISPHKVCVKYRFLNESDQDIGTTVAFPLPPENRVSLFFAGGADPATILKSFKVLVNGSPVETKLARKAVIGERDITEQLRKLGLSDEEIFFDVVYEELEPLLSKYEKIKDEYGDWWRISQTLFWEMNFPSGKEIVVEHEYSPAIGEGWTIVYNREDSKTEISNLWNSFTGKHEENEVCLDQTTKRAIENRIRVATSNGAEEVGVKCDSVEYILGTGRNWKGPIGELRLRLVKEKPDQFVSVCFPGQPTKVSPTVYEFYQKDYVPQDTLVVYFYTVD
jgi:hypothetical protein